MTSTIIDCNQEDVNDPESRVMSCPYNGIELDSITSYGQGHESVLVVL